MLLEAAAASAHLLRAVSAMPEMTAAESGDAKPAGELADALAHLGVGMVYAACLAGKCGQCAAAAEAERVIGSALQLVAVSCVACNLPPVHIACAALEAFGLVQ